MIEARGLTKRYGDKVAVDDLSFTVRPRAVTGFLGPNGAGKSTTMRLILGLDAPTSGSVTVNGRLYAGSRVEDDTMKALGVVARRLGKDEPVPDGSHGADHGGVGGVVAQGFAQGAYVDVDDSVVAVVVLAPHRVEELRLTSP
jgi:ABC-type molybdenum transport system ATPase subunit/photorepair protein PhrA